MGIKNGKNKKEAAALVLLLIVLTTLAVMIASTMKILIGSDSRFSHNRNARGGNSATTTGKFFCYKKWENGEYKLYQKRVDYAADGSVSSIQDSNKPVDKCEFEIPQGVKNYEVVIVAGGGSGGSSSYEMGNVDTGETYCGSLSLDNHAIAACESARKKILEKMNIKVTCKKRFTPKNLTCTPYITFSEALTEFNCESFDSYIKNAGRYVKFDMRTGSMFCDNSPYANHYYTQTITMPNEILCSTLTINYDVDNRIYAPTNLNLPKSGNGLIICNAIRNNYLNSFLNNTKYSIQNASYNIYSGQPGGAGDVTTVNLKGNIYGKDGADSITIEADDIGNGGRIIDGVGNNGGDTTFSYWHKNSSTNTYTEVKHFSAGGMAGIKPSNPSIVFKSAAEVETVKSHEGIMPDYLKIPSVFNFSNLYAGFINNLGERIAATFFGASGASGRIDGIDDQKLINCSYTKFQPNKDDNTLTFDIDRDNVDNCTTDVSSEDKLGSDGAPGAILISW